MLQALFDYFRNLFVLEFPSGDMLEDSLVSIGGHLVGEELVYDENGLLVATNRVFNDSIYLDLPSYFALLCSIISLIIIVTLCALFIWKIVKLIGGLIR